MKVLGLLFVLHYIADFLLQSRNMGKNKSSNYRILLTHISIIFVVITLGLWILVPIKIAAKVGLVNCVIHGLIDKNIWNIYKVVTGFRLIGVGGNLTHQEKVTIFNQFKYWEDKLFYDTIGFDQLLHSLTLLLVYGMYL